VSWPLSGLLRVESAYLPAPAALAGSAIGDLTSLASAWLTQHRRDRVKRVSRDKARRQKLYKQFIDESSKLCADTLLHAEAEVSALFGVYVLIRRMRALSSFAVVETMEAVVRMIVDTYFAPNKTFPELLKLMNSHALDPLRAFSEECRPNFRLSRIAEHALNIAAGILAFTQQ
jgi:hypothetical protein